MLALSTPSADVTFIFYLFMSIAAGIAAWIAFGENTFRSGAFWLCAAFTAFFVLNAWIALAAT